MAKIAISNIAWQESKDEQAFSIMRNLGISCLEMSPFRDGATISEAKKRFNKRISGLLRKYRIRVVAFQALMFRYPEISLFEDEKVRNEMLKHLIGILEFANYVGASSVVFGSPKNKIRGGLPYEKSLNIAKNFFRKLAEKATTLNIAFCIEPTPAVYGADFICNTQEAINLVKSIGHKSLKINLDIGSSILNDENIDKIVTDNTEYIGHVHVSEPYLKTINLNRAFHQDLGKALKAANYKGIISIEMLSTDDLDTQKISEIISFVKDTYQ